MAIFCEGLKIKKIYFPDEVYMEIGQTITFGGGEFKIISISVTMENGQMAEIPWIKVEASNGSTQLWNAALVEGVEL